MESDGTYSKLWINAKELPDHLGHGDGVLGGDVPGMDYYIFDNDCNIICDTSLLDQPIPDVVPPYHTFDAVQCDYACIGVAGDPVPEMPFHVFDKECTPVCKFPEDHPVPDVDYSVFDSECNAICEYTEADPVPEMSHHVFDNECKPTCMYFAGNFAPDIDYHDFDYQECDYVCQYSESENLAPDKDYNFFNYGECKYVCDYSGEVTAPPVDYHFFDVDLGSYVCEYPEGHPVPNMLYYVFDNECTPTCDSSLESPAPVPENMPYHIFDPNECNTSAILRWRVHNLRRICHTTPSTLSSVTTCVTNPW